MTMTLDPAVVAQIVEATRACLKREMELAKTPTGPPLREVWRDWDRLILSIPVDQEGARGDAKVCRVHASLILDLEFEYEGKMMKLGDVPCEQLSPLMGQAWLRVLRLRPKKNGGPTSPTYRDRVVTTLQTCVSWKLGKAANPIHGWKREGGEGRKRTGCFEDEKHVEEYLQYLPAWLRPIVRIAVGPGCNRLSEVLYLKKTEILWGQGRISLPKQRGRIKGDARSFPVSKLNMEALRVISDASPSPTLVFCKPNGSKWSTNYVQKLMRDATEESGIRLGPKGEKPTFHYFRRTGATHRLMKDGDLIAARVEGGWKCAQTMQGYQDLTAEAARNSAEMADIPVSVAIKARGERLRSATRENPTAATPTRRRSSRSAG